MPNTHSMSPQDRAALAETKMNWQRGGDKVSTAGCKQIDFRPLQVKPHPRQAQMDAYRNVKSLFA